MNIEWLIPTIFSVINIGILIYNLKINRDSLQFRQWAEMLQSSNILVVMNGLIRDIVITITNLGNTPIDESTIEIDCNFKNNVDYNVEYKYNNKNILLKQESFNVPLCEKINDFMIGKNLITVHTEEVSNGTMDPWSNEIIYWNEEHFHISREYSLFCDIKVTYRIHSLTNIVNKKYKIDFKYVEGYMDRTILSDFECRYSDNYDINITGITGQWIE